MSLANVAQKPEENGFAELARLCDRQLHGQFAAIAMQGVNFDMLVQDRPFSCCEKMRQTFFMVSPKPLGNDQVAHPSAAGIAE